MERLLPLQILLLKLNFLVDFCFSAHQYLSEFLTECNVLICFTQNLFEMRR